MEQQRMSVDLLENPANGIGDAILFAWLADAAQRAGRGLPLYLSRHHDWLVPMPSVRPLLTHRPGRIGRDREQEWKWLTGREREMRQSGEASHRLDAWARAYGLEGLDFEAPLLELHERDHDFADTWWAKAIEHCDRGAGATKVLVFPNCAWPQRTWPRAYWVDLVMALHHAGMQVMVMASGEREHQECQYPFSVYGNTPGQCWAIMEQADLVVAADTGPSHASVTLGKPTVVMQGPTRAEWVFGHALDCVTAVDAREIVPCTGCDLDNDKGFRPACCHGCQSLFALTPTMALEAVLGAENRLFKEETPCQA